MWTSVSEEMGSCHMPYSVNRIKTVNQGKREEVLNMGFLLEDCKILSKKCFDTETLSRIMPQGRYQLWAGTKSSIINSELATKIFLEVEKSRQESDPTASPVEINIVKGGSHGWPLVHNMGFSREIKEEKSSEDQVKQVELADLETSVMAKILKEIK